MTAEVSRNLCPFCKMLFKRNSSLNAHIDAMHERLRMYKCSVCGYSTTHVSHFKTHIKTHENPEEIILQALQNIPNYCSICQKYFKKDHALTEHMALVHNDEKPYSCDICDKEFAKLANYMRHMKTHEDGDAVQCEVCDAKFRTTAEMYRHLKEIHPDRKHKCEKCGAEFTRKGNLRDHMKIHEAEKDVRRSFRCPVEGCNSTFTRKSNLTTHLETLHGGILPHSCPECGKAFRYKSLLEKHMESHNREEVEVIELINFDLIGLEATDTVKKMNTEL